MESEGSHMFGLTVGVLVALFVGAAAVWLAERNVKVRMRRRVAADEGLARETGAAAVETVEIAACDGVKLCGWLLRPGVWRGEAALLLHGFVDSRAAVLTPDSRGHGESGGATVSFGLHEADDVLSWGDWLCGRLEIASFVALGQSMGAAVLINALPREERLTRIVAESPFTTFREAAYDKLAGRAGIPRWLAHLAFRPIGEVAFLYVRWRYGFNLHATRPVDALRRAGQPVLLIHGSDDEAILAQHSRRLQATSGAEYWEVEGAGHTEPIRVAPREYERRVIDWFTTSR
jgi:uncharacterized protein